jgi:predicted DNA-binding transcriptional regulator YafY
MAVTDFDATRARLLELYKLLDEVSVTSRTVTLGKIMDSLDDKGELGSFERRTFYKDLSLLNEITNLRIEYAPRLRAYKVERKEELSKSELSIIINAILSARFDSETETRSLADKLYTFAGKKKMPGGTHRITNRVKLGDDKDVLDKIDFIQYAIDENRKILFDYQKYSFEKNYEVLRRDCIVSPYKILWHHDKMYLVGNFEGSGFSHYRIERICNYRKTNEIRKPINEITVNGITGFGRPFDEAEYLRRMAEVSSGELLPVVMMFQNEHLCDVFDAFGKNTCIKDNGNGTFTFEDEVIISKKLVRWILGFGDSVEVIKPKKLKSKVVNAIQSAAEKYTV